MPQPLENFIEPGYIKGIIQQTFYSKRGSQNVWCIVEGLDDIEIYEKFFDISTTTTSPAKADILGKGGYKNVVEIVIGVSKEEPQCHIFGICDRDYTRYRENFIFPNMVFLTDDRDIEIMMLNSPSVQNGLNAWNSQFSEKLNVCINACKYLGYLRIYNHIHDTNCTFHRNVEFSKVWDMKTHTLKNNWQVTLLDAFTKHCDNYVEKEQVTQFINDEYWENESWRNICRGHDILALLQYMMIKREYSADKIFRKIANDYTLEDFKASSLCKSIERWAITKNVVVLKS